MPDIPFDEWWLELRRIARREGWCLNDKATWSCYWSDGLSPEETLRENLYWQSA